MSRKAKYQFGGDDSFFSQLADLYRQRMDYANQPYEQQDYNLSDIADQQDQSDSDYEELLGKYNELEDKVTALESQASTNVPHDYGDSFMDFIFGDDNNLPIDWSDDVVGYKDDKSGESSNMSGIYKVEGGKTGEPTNLKSSAVGKGQMIKGTRFLMYKKLGIPKSSYEEAEQVFRTDPIFEDKVINAYREDLDARIPKNIQGKEREYMIAKGWYTGDPFYPDNVVPHPEAGNRITAGEFARRATSKFQFGGVPVAETRQELYEGMNNPDYAQYGEMVLDLPPQYNLIRGLDNGHPLKVQDQRGKASILRGPNHTEHFFGKVYEKMQTGGVRGPIGFINSYFNSDYVKNKNPYEYEDIMKTFKEGSQKYHPFVMEKDPLNLGSRKGYEELNKKAGAPKNTNVLLSVPQTKSLQADLLNDILPHEYAHSVRHLSLEDELQFAERNKNKKIINLFSKYLNDSTETKFREFVPQSNFSGWVKMMRGEHDIAPDENYSDLMSIRYLMYKQGIYDARKGPMTKEQLEAAKKDPFIKKQFNFKRMRRMFSDDNIIELNNKVVKNNTPLTNRDV